MDGVRADVPEADTTGKRLGRAVVVLVGAVVAAAAGWLLFVEVAGGDLARMLALVLVIGIGVAGARMAGGLAASWLAPYNVAEVAVEGPIARDGRGPVPWMPGAVPIDRVVEQIERADADDNVEALVVRLNTPGGEVVPSDDVRIAVQRFDGPTVAYATDTCASGGYWIASGCDRIFAREGSVVGSIGVIGSRVNAHDAAERLGLDYERFAAGRFKDAGTPLKELTDEERSYLQGIIDDYYETFVDRVTEGRALEPDEVRETEARVYLGEEAQSVGLVDRIGTMEDVRESLADELGTGVTVRTFEPSRGFRERIGASARGVAYALGAGVASAVVGTDDVGGFEFKVR